MNGLHFQGYASVLWLVQFAVLLHAYWIRNKLAAADVAVLALLGFGQVWLSFDFVFVVVLLTLPLWLMRMAEGVVLGPAQPVDRGARSAGWIFAAHLMHLAQVIVYFGGVRDAIDDYARVAVLRLCDIDGTPYVVWLGLNAVQIYLSHGRAERALLCLVSACHRAGRIDRAGAVDGISTGCDGRVSGSGRLPPLMPPRCSVRGDWPALAARHAAACVVPLPLRGPALLSILFLAACSCSFGPDAAADFSGNAERRIYSARLSTS